MKRGAPGRGCTGGGGRLLSMPVLDPNPTDGHKKLIQMAFAILGLMVFIGIIASIAAHFG